MVGEELADPSQAEERLLCPDRIDLGFHRTRTHETAGHGVDLDHELGDGAQLGRQVLGDDRAQLDHRVVAPALHATGALEQSRSVALDYARAAREFLRDEPDLEALTHIVIDRER